MKLRARLALSVLGVTVITYGTLAVIDRVSRHRAAAGMLQAIVHERLSSDRVRCEEGSSPWDGSGLDGGPPHRRFPPPPHEGMPPPPPPQMPLRGPPGPPPGDGHMRGPPRPATVFPYDAALRAKHPDAPRLDTDVLDELASAEAVVVGGSVFAQEVEVLVRSPWGEGPCSYVLARGTITQWGSLLPHSFIWVLPTFLVGITVLLTVGPTVGRLRRLTSAVRGGETNAVARADKHGDEISELSSAFDEAEQKIRAQLDELVRREKALRDFVANTTHDVMIPLTVLQGHLTRLREDGANAPALGAAMNEAHYVGSLLHNLGLAARLDSAQPSVQVSSVDVGGLLKRVLARHRPIAEERRVSIDAAEPLEPLIVMADAMLLEQAVTNLTYNAVRYNNADGHVALIAERIGDRFVIRVLDDGPGIPPEQLATIFERGVRGNDARNRNAGGQGLGLDIARRALALQGFEIHLEHGVNGGLEARIEGPV